MSDRVSRVASVVGRVLLSLIFFMSAMGKLADWKDPHDMMVAKGLPAVDALLSIAVALEILGSLLVIVGLKARWGAVLLLVFMVPVTFIMHNFWTLEGGAAREQMINFMKNISIMGGLLLVVAFGAGAFSIDARKAAPHTNLPG